MDANRAGDLERALAGIWAVVLKRDAIGLDDNFFEVGGQSIVAMELLGRVADELDVELPFVAIFQCPTVRQMSQAVRREAVLRPVRRAAGEPIPLTFSQRWEWSVLGLAGRHSTRAVARAVRVAVPLDIDGMKKSFADVSRRHESLCTRIVSVAGVPMQTIASPDDNELSIVAVVGDSAESRVIAARGLVEEFVHEPFDVEAAPLFAALLLRLGGDEHVLVVAMDHLISDAVSLEILLRDWWVIYEATMRGTSSALPEVPIQFADFAVWQQSTQAAWAQRHAAYWERRLAGARSLQQFSTAGGAEGECPTMGRLAMTIGKDVTQGLRDLSRRESTTLVMSVLTAYVTLLLRWCEETDLVVTFLSAGRFCPQIANTIGYFAAPLYLRIELLESDCFRDVLKRVTQEYAAACEHADSGRIAVQTPQPEFVWNPRFNWIPGKATSLPGRCAFEFSPRPDIQRGGGFELVMTDAGGELRGSIWYRTDRFLPATLERFESSFQSYLRRLASEPAVRVRTL